MIKEWKIYKQLVGDKQYVIMLAMYTFLFLFFCSKMSPLYPSNEWADPNIYFNVGKTMMHGKTLYTEVFDHKGPFIFVIYGIGALIGGSTFFGVYLLQGLFWFVGLFFVFLLGKKILGDNSLLAFILSILVPPFVLTHLYYGGAAEEFVLCFMLVSSYLFVYYFTKEKTGSHNPKHMLVHGLIVAMTFFIKLNLTAFFIFPLLAIFLTILCMRNWLNLAKNILYFLIGLLIVTLPICLYLALNGALTEAYEVYILLNKEIASDVNTNEIIKAGTKIMYEMARTFPIETLLIVIGFTYFPIRHLKNIAGTVSIILSGFILCAVIFFSGSYHFYYPLPLYVFLPLGLVSLMSLASKVFTLEIKENKKPFAFLITTALICSIAKVTFFGMGGQGLARLDTPIGSGYQFALIIEKESNPTLLNLAHGDPNNIYTRCNIVPNVKYFFSPNIPHDKYPAIRDEQTKYIENKEVKFIIMNSWTKDLEHFENLPALHENYSIVDTYEEYDEYQPGKYGKNFVLYKLNDK